MLCHVLSMQLINMLHYYSVALEKHVSISFLKGFGFSAYWWRVNCSIVDPVRQSTFTNSNTMTL